jgi:alpha-glucan phosphorylase-like protein
LERIVSLSASLKGAGGENRFSMTGLAFRGSRWVNAVSQIHQRVSQGMFNNLYPDLEEKEVPVGHVTNGAHVPFWAAPEWQSLFFETLGEDWPQRLRDVAYWRQLEKVPLERFAEIKLVLKNRLVDWIRKRLGQELAQDGHRQSYAEVLARLDSRTLIIGHAKRMAPYKRADLLFQDAEALHELLQKSPVPILFIYAGKAHPSDGLGQEILQKITAWSRDPRFKGSVLLLEDYDLSYARRLIAGVDVWLNTPLRPLEASGTSGMKAAMNGTLHFSIADGWWPEAYNGRNGWMVGDGSELWDQEEQDSFDRRRILHILEHDILPEFTNLGEGGWSRPWAARMRESIASVVPSMSSERMLEDYQSRLYKPALRAAERLEKDGYAELKALVGFKQMLRDHWDQVEFAAVDLDQLGAETVQRGEATEMSVTLAHPGLSATHIQLQAILGRRVGHRQPRESRVVPLECVSDRSARDRSKWRLALDNAHSGEYTLALRAIPQAFPGLEDPAFELKMVKWM